MRCPPRLYFRSFVIYIIYDLPYASKLTQPLLFDDDTSIFYSLSDPDYLESVLNDEVWNLDIWMKCNKLSVNFKKTSYIIFKLRQKKLGKSFFLSFGNQTWKQVNGTKFLGVYIDDHFARKPHISFVDIHICDQLKKNFLIYKNVLCELLPTQTIENTLPPYFAKLGILVIS